MNPCLLRQFPLLLGMARTASLAEPSGRWFGTGHLDGHFVLAIGLIFGLSAVALCWLRLREHHQHVATAIS